MTLATLVLLPLIAAAVTFLLRDRPLLTSGLALGILAIEANIMRLAGSQARLEIGPASLVVSRFDTIFIILFIAVAAFAVAYAHWVQQLPDFPSRLLLVLGCTIATILAENPFLAVFLLQLTGLATLCLVYIPQAGGASYKTFQKYVILVVLSAFFLVLAYSLFDSYLLYRDNILLAKLIVALLAAGFGLRLAMVPFHLWLTDLSEHLPAMSTVIVVTSANLAALLLTLSMFEWQPWLLKVAGGDRLLLVGSIGAILGTAILALGEKNLYRIFAYGAAHSSGFVLLGLASGTAVGLAGAMFEALNQSLALLVIFMSLGVITHGTTETDWEHLAGLRFSLPISGLGLLIGTLSLLGLPPLAGFASQWMIYSVVAQHSHVLVVAVACGSAVATFAMLRTFLKVFFGQSPTSKAVKEPLQPKVLILMGSALLIVIGLAPNPVLDAIRSAAAGFLHQPWS